MLRACLERLMQKWLGGRPALPQLCWAELEAPSQAEQSPELERAILRVNRNARWPKQANHGSRPCSSVMRRLKKQGTWRKWKENMTLDADEMNPKHLHDYKPGEMEEGTEAKPAAAAEKKEEGAKKKEGEGDKDQG